MSELSRSVRVLHLVAPAREGGIQRVITMMSAGQVRDRVHVAAVLSPTDADDHPFIAGLEALGIPVTRVVVQGRSYLREYRSLSALVERLRPGVIHTHGYHADVIGGRVARVQGVRTVSTVHGFVGAPPLRNLLYERLQAIALRRADAVIAVAAPLVDRLARAGVSRGKIHLVPNGFSPETPIVTRAAARRELGIPADARVAGWIGRLSREKGADVMLEALSQCERQWRLSMIGDGPERARLHQQAAKLAISDRVTWHGQVANAGGLLSAFDAFVLSSRTEGTPIALFESMHAGVPIVASRVGGVPHVVGSAHALLVPSEQPAMIARALAELEREPSAAARRSVLARDRLRQSFGPGTWLAAIDAVYCAVGV